MPQRLQHHTAGSSFHLTGLILSAELTPGLKDPLPHTLTDAVAQPAPPSGRTASATRPQSG